MSESGFAPCRGPGIVQLHPTLTCNLTCRHCYSESSPAQRLVLEETVLTDFLEDASGLGYSVLAVSGGEPFMYRGLARLLRRAKALGMRTTVTTNATLLQPHRLGPVSSELDLLAISVEGPPSEHDAIRGAGCFARVLEGVEAVRQAGVPFGFIFTLTRSSWRHLEWMGQFAKDEGAALLQIHPLEMTGRASLEMARQSTDESSLSRAYLMAFALAAEHAGSLEVQVDLLPVEQLRRNPETVYAAERSPEDIEGAPAAELLETLVVEADGAVVPISYGFSRAFQVGDLRQQRLGEAWDEYRSSRYQAFRDLCRTVWDEVIASDVSLTNWQEVVVERSLDFTAGGPTHPRRLQMPGLGRMVRSSSSSASIR
jgi:MoaA/NifB/PqqE/SkfB family radical SAM enzyme